MQVFVIERSETYYYHLCIIMKKISLLFFIFIFSFSLFSFAFAQSTTGGAPASGIIPSGGLSGSTLGQVGITNTTTLVDTILGLVRWLAWAVSLLAVVFGLWAAILFITAGGDPEKVGSARHILLYAIVGVVVAVLAFGIVGIAKSFIVIP